MTKKIIFGTILFLVVLTGYYFKTTIATNPPPPVITAEDAPDEAPQKPSESINADSPAEITSAKPVSGDETTRVLSKAEIKEQYFLKKGYQKDPDRPGRYFKKSTDTNGKPITTFIEEDDVFEPEEKTVKEAVELLDLKSNLAPQEEFSTLKNLDKDSKDNSTMILGVFRDDQNDIEFDFHHSFGADTRNNVSEEICFYAPKFKISFPSATKYQARGDETGYSIVRLADNLYLRMMWSFEEKRVVHGQIVGLKAGQPSIIKTFAAAEVSGAEADKLKYCK